MLTKPCRVSVGIDLEIGFSVVAKSLSPNFSTTFLGVTKWNPSALPDLLP